MNRLLNVDELAAILRKAATSVRSDAHRNPSSLPPRCKLPKTKRLLWRENDVEKWLSENVCHEQRPLHSKNRSRSRL